MMSLYQKLVIKWLQEKGKSFEDAEWATNQLDMDHYAKKYFPKECAELIIAMWWMIEQDALRYTA